jgi:hypothetical protein
VTEAAGSVGEAAAEEMTGDGLADAAALLAPGRAGVARGTLAVVTAGWPAGLLAVTGAVIFPCPPAGPPPRPAQPAVKVTAASAAAKATARARQGRPPFPRLD